MTTALLALMLAQPPTHSHRIEWLRPQPEPEVAHLARRVLALESQVAWLQDSIATLLSQLAYPPAGKPYVITPVPLTPGALGGTPIGIDESITTPPRLKGPKQ